MNKFSTILLALPLILAVGCKDPDPKKEHKLLPFQKACQKKKAHNRKYASMHAEAFKVAMATATVNEQKKKSLKGRVFVVNHFGFVHPRNWKDLLERGLVVSGQPFHGNNDCVLHRKGVIEVREEVGDEVLIYCLADLNENSCSQCPTGTLLYVKSSEVINQTKEYIAFKKRAAWEKKKEAVYSRVRAELQKNEGLKKKKKPVKKMRTYLLKADDCGKTQIFLSVPVRLKCPEKKVCRVKVMHANKVKEHFLSNMGTGGQEKVLEIPVVSEVDVLSIK